MIRRTLLPLLLLAAALTAWAQPALRVARHNTGFSLSKNIGGRDILLAYSPTGDFDRAMDTDTLFRQIVKAFEAQEKLAGPTFLPDASLPTAVEPLCTDVWNQESPYNHFTPTINDQHCLTGCVAHAMAEVLYYYRYPERGTGSHTYTDSLGCGETLTADFNHPYDWDYILDDYSGTPSQRQIDAVARLLSDCGIAVNMKYGIDASGAEPVYQPIALVNHFGFSPATRMIYRDFYPRNELYSILYRELAARRPILLSGWRQSGGHAFIIDGYDNAGLFHLNWGMGGYADGYYNLDYLTANQPEWGEYPDRREKGLNLIQCFTIGIEPLPQALSTTSTHEFAFSAIEALPADDNSQLSVAIHRLANVGWNEHDGRVCIALQSLPPAAASQTQANTRVSTQSTRQPQSLELLYTYDHAFELEEITDITYTDTISLTIPSTLPDGAYHLMPVYEESDGTWSKARTSRGTPNYLLVQKQGQAITATLPQSATAELQLLDFQFPDTVVRHQQATYSLTLHNAGASQFCGRVYIVCDDDRRQKGYQLVQSIGLYLDPEEQTTVDFRYSDIRIDLDKLTLRVLYDSDLFSDETQEFDIVRTATVVNQSNAIATTTIDTSARPVLYDTSGRPSRQPHTLLLYKGGKTILRNPR